MFKIDNLLLERDETRKFRAGIDATLNKYALPYESQQKIISLLDKKLDILESISYSDADLKETSLKLEALDARIYDCLRTARYELKNNNDKMIKFVQEPIFKYYSDKYNAKNIREFQKATIEFIKKYYFLLIMLMGAIPFIFYFIVQGNIGFLPELDTLNAISLFGTIAISGAGLLFILYLFPALCIVWTYSSRDIAQDYKSRFPKEFPLVLIMFCLMIISLRICRDKAYNIIKKHTSLKSYIWALFGLSITRVLFNKAKDIVALVSRALNKIKDIKAKNIVALVSRAFDKAKDVFINGFEAFLFIIINEILWSCSFIGLLFIVYMRIGDNHSLIPIFLAIFFSMMSIVALILVKDSDIYKLSIYLFIIANFTILFLVSGSIIRISSYGNIDYKMLSLKKDALNALPKNVCQNNQNGCIGAGAKDGCYAKQKAQIVSYNKQKAELTVKDGNETYIFSGVNDEIKFIDANGTDIGVAFSDEVVFENSVLTYDKNGTRSDPLKASAINLSPVCKTYALKQNDDSVRLYNVKVLSALGKFYYLQTKSGEKFELDSSLIISKQKAGDTR